MTDDPRLTSDDDPEAMTRAVVEREQIGDLPLDGQIGHLRNRATDLRAEADRLSRAAHRLTIARNHRLAAPGLRERRQP